MKNGYKFWIIFSLIVVFVAGVAAGILLENSLLEKKPEKTPRKRSSVRFPSLEIMAEELRLTPEQQNKIREIFRNSEQRLRKYWDQIHDEFASMRTQIKSDIEGVLTEEQKKEFEAMIEKYVLERKKAMRRRDRSSRKPERSKGGRR